MGEAESWEVKWRGLTRCGGLKVWGHQDTHDVGAER